MSLYLLKASTLCLTKLISLLKIIELTAKGIKVKANETNIVFKLSTHLST